MSKVKTKKFLSPIQLKKRFGISNTDYEWYLTRGLPSYGCAGVTRHPIDEVYLWFEDNNIEIEEYQSLCNAPQLRRLLGIDKRTLERWEENGLPKVLDTTKYPHSFKYNTNTVITWLKSQNNDMET